MNKKMMKSNQIKSNQIKSKLFESRYESNRITARVNKYNKNTTQLKCCMDKLMI
jgi:hypothetical protein